MIEQGKIYSDTDVFTRRARHKDGHYLWIESSSQVVRDEQGNVKQILTIGRDITQRKKYEDMLAKAQHLAKMGSWEWDMTKSRLTVSREMRNIFGFWKMRAIILILITDVFLLALLLTISSDLNG